MVLPIDSEERFGALFVALPWEVMENVCNRLPVEYIPTVFLKVPSLRKFIVETYYAEEVSFYLLDTDGKGAFNFFYEPSPSNIIGLENTKKFLAENPDIVPKQYRICPDRKYTGLEELLRSCQDALGLAEGLSIEFSATDRGSWPEREDPSKKLMYLIFSFRNLVLLKAWFHKGHFELLSQHENLEDFTLQAMGKIDWSSFSLPSNLKKFDLYIDSESDLEIDYDLEGDSGLEGDSDLDIDSEFGFEDNPALDDLLFGIDDEKRLITDDEVFNLFWSKPELTRLTPDMSRCPNLTELTLNNCRLEYIDFSLFPHSLTSLELLCNTIDYIEHDPSKTGSQWPENLQVLSLSDNHMPDVVIDKLSKMGWPSRLESLFLCNNEITSLKYLFNLPETLETLYLNDNHHLTDLNLVNDGTGYRIANLPDSLEDLVLYWCENIDWGHLGRDRPTQVLERLHLPPNLKKLDLHDCRLKTTEHFVLPPSLVTVNNRGVDIMDFMRF